MDALKMASATVVTIACTLCVPGLARADEATVTVGDEPAEPPPRTQPTFVADDGLLAREPELRRSPVRLKLGPMGVTTGKGFGLGVGIGADFGTGSVGGRLAAAWLRG